MHVDGEGNLAVVALLYEFGQQNSTLFRLWADVPEHDGGSVPLSPGVTAEDLLPDVRDYYRVNGSLTEPPCSEGVWWLILKQPLSASRDQVAVFDELVHHSNRRPIQPLNARPVLR
jgi:carbonic anhydrase